MIEAWSVPDVYAAEDDLIGALPDGELMARAVSALVEVALVRLGQRGGQRVVALVGSGNNGADALYAAAQLAGQGFSAHALTTARGHTGARQAAAEAGVSLRVADDDPSPARDVLAGADLVLDGIAGIGGRAGLAGWGRAWVEAIPDGAYVIAVDTPSGQDPSGRSPVDPAGVFADETVTFSVLKPAHLLPPIRHCAGALTVVDIGLKVPTTPAVVQLQAEDVPDRWPVPGPASDKYSRGVLGVIAGGEHYTGAAMLCCTAAVCAGAGMVRYVGTPAPHDLVRMQVPEVVHGPGQVQAWVVGPGLDLQADDPAALAQLDAAEAALATQLPVLLDAGGLDLIDVDAPRRGAPTLLTPHAGECARLLSRLGRRQITRADVEATPVEAATLLADLTGATVLLKGSTTLVVPPGRDTPIHCAAEAPAWLASAGAGDVLAGLAGTLLAAGLSPPVAGAVAAVVHGAAADQANPGGPVRALDLAHGLPRTIATLLRPTRT
ncbi:MAG: bifunctional ADP-dependent NAD(P)H-hydrate dehydratase/NAD(P)H-hydrate epimerase [Nostocoides sp.]